MNATLGYMKLQEILRRHGITELRVFMERAGLNSRQQAWSLWHGEAGVGKVMAKRLHERLQIPLAELLEVDPVPYTKPRKPQGTTKKPRARRPRSEGRNRNSQAG